MTEVENDVNGDPLGPLVAGWTPRPRQPREPMIGHYCSLVPLDRDTILAEVCATVQRYATGA